MGDFNLTEFTDSFFSQTYSFDVQAVCYAPNHRIDGVTLEDACKIDWNPNGTVRAYGPIERGQFEGNPDIAGLGSLHALLKASSDALTVITLSYVINFGISGKCTLSGYHYIFGINTMLIAFASITLCVTLVRDYWAAPFAAFLRTATHVVIFALIGRLLAYEWTGEMLPEPLYIRNKAENNTDSSLFLPVACFLDHDLNPLDKLTQAQLKRIGWGEPKLLMEFPGKASLFESSHSENIQRVGGRSTFRKMGQVVLESHCVWVCID
ncbi:hypothetical protein E8E14_014397 [Neopestalotiopsis sp. 37M]|nr:hypothetical protein E8E14_014397 [Neopestalotiopsis sp. 37M]